MSVRIKICGITNLDDAWAAIDAGADALGFIMHKASPRYVTLSAMGKIIGRMPPFLAKVGVFVNAPPKLAASAVEDYGLDTLQFHGDETPAYCRQFAPVAVLKAFRVQGPETLKTLGRYRTSAWLLDSYVPGKQGGAGATFNWDLAREAKQLGRPIVLAGGLTVGNVAEAIRHTRPFGVDVSSGVESSPGRKDRRLLVEFIRQARSADARSEV